MVQWLKFRASTAEGVGPIPGQGTKIRHAMVWLPKKKRKERKKYKVNSQRQRLEMSTTLKRRLTAAEHTGSRNPPLLSSPPWVMRTLLTIETDQQTTFHITRPSRLGERHPLKSRQLTARPHAVWAPGPFFHHDLSSPAI